ncbi:MAG TPA: hypothetical protein VIM56_15375 [Rhizomicrobium sp.]
MSLTAAQARKIILSFKGVTEKSALGGGVAFHVGKEFFVQIGTREPDTLMLKYPTLDERDMMLQAHPDTLYITEHFKTYKGLLARLSALDAKTLRALLDQRLNVIAQMPRRRPARTR